MLRFRDIKYLDKTILIIVMVLFIIGLFFVYSASFVSGKWIQFFMKQIIWMIIGIIVFWIVVNIDFHFLASMAYVIYFLSILLLLFVLVIGKVQLGAQRWFQIGGIAFQPSEIMKITMILVVARYLSDHYEERRTLKYIIIPFILTIIPVVLIIKQPDLGTAIIFLPLLFIMLFAAGARLRHLGIIIILGIIALPILWMFLHDYQKMRLMVFINPNIDPLGSGYTAIQSRIAIGSGSFSGVGWLMGTQNRLRFLPERHTDFIFSVLAEEMGFIGSVFVIILFILLIINCLRIADMAGDIFGGILGVGISSMIFIHVFYHIVF